MINRLLNVFASFERHEVRYVVIGGIAAVLHGVPRATFDLDILIEATPDNAQSLLNALTEADFATALLLSSSRTRRRREVSPRSSRGLVNKLVRRKLPKSRSPRRMFLSSKTGRTATFGQCDCESFRRVARRC